MQAGVGKRTQSGARAKVTRAIDGAPGKITIAPACVLTRRFRNFISPALARLSIYANLSLLCVYIGVGVREWSGEEHDRAPAPRVYVRYLRADAPSDFPLDGGRRRRRERDRDVERRMKVLETYEARTMDWVDAQKLGGVM